MSRRIKVRIKTRAGHRDLNLETKLESHNLQRDSKSLYELIRLLYHDAFGWFEIVSVEDASVIDMNLYELLSQVSLKIEHELPSIQNRALETSLELIKSRVDRVLRYLGDAR